VHQAVCPIKIGIVQEDHQDDTEKEIEVAMLIDVLINSCITVLSRNNGKENDRAENKDTYHGIADLSQDMFVFRIPLLDLRVPECPFFPDIKDKIKYTCEQKIA